MKHVFTIFAAPTIVARIGPNPSLDIADVGPMPLQVVRQAWAVQVTDALPIGAATLDQGTS